MKKARVWLDARGKAYAFHDYKKQVPMLPAKLAGLKQLKAVGKGVEPHRTAFRKLPDADKDEAGRGQGGRGDGGQPSAIKRPIVEHEGGLLLGFRPDEWEAAFT